MTEEGLSWHAKLRVASNRGDISSLNHYLKVVLPSLSREDRLQICVHGLKRCPDFLCLTKITLLAEDAVGNSQLAVFEYFWDTFLGPGGVRLSWKMLERSAEEGMIDFAESFWARDSQCFKILSPSRPRGPPKGMSQLRPAIMHNHYDYADSMLARGADVNDASPFWNIARTAISYSEETVHRIQFLIDRGAIVQGVGAVREAVIYCREVLPLLLLNGCDPNEAIRFEGDDEYDDSTRFRRTPLIEAARRGYLEAVKLLLAHGADINGVDDSGLTALEAAERNNQEEVVRFLQTQYLNFIIWLCRYAKRKDKIHKE